MTDKIDGCGWKFISTVDNYTICNGVFVSSIISFYAYSF